MEISKCFILRDLNIECIDIDNIFILLQRLVLSKIGCVINNKYWCMGLMDKGISMARDDEKEIWLEINECC